MAPSLPGMGLFWEMGLGKTYGAIRILCNAMNKDKRLYRILIFTKALVIPQWKEEWLKFSKVNPGKVTLLMDAGKKRLSEFIKQGFEPGTPAQRGHIFVTNYESLLMKDLYEQFHLWKPEATVYDESDELKNPQAERSKLAHLLSNPWDKPNKRPAPKPLTYCLTGTPVLNSPLDIFQQVKVMLGGWPLRQWFLTPAPQFLIENYYHFRARYFRDRNAGMQRENYFPKWELMTEAKDGVDAEREIRETLEKISVRATKAEALDLPDEVPVIVRVGMTKDQARVYKDMKQEFISYYNGKACVADLAIVKALRLMQIASGFVSTQGIGEDDDKADFRFDKTPKDEAVEELLASITPHSKVLLWAVWQENYPQLRRICEKLKIEYVEAHGQISDKKKRDNVEYFKTSSTPRVFIGHPGSGGIGLNLTTAPYSIFYSRNFSLRQYLQSRARNHRAGQTEKVTHYDLVCEGTIDALALDKLAGKMEIGAKILGDLAKELVQQL